MEEWRKSAELRSRGQAPACIASGVYNAFAFLVTILKGGCGAFSLLIAWTAVVDN